MKLRISASAKFSFGGKYIMRIFKIILLGFIVLLLNSYALFAVPTFQTYVVGSEADDYNGDQDTWFTTNSSFSLIVVGSYGPKTLQPLTEVTLLLSVPEGQVGEITITGGDGVIPLNAAPSVPGPSGLYNPKTDADTELLSNETGNAAGFDGHLTKNFLPDEVTFNNHYPLQNDVSNFILYGIGDFYNLGPIHNYNADNGGSITLEGEGQEKTFEVSVSGFSWVHFDAYGFEVTDNGKVIRSTWDINPGSHDATFIPAPGAILLGGTGLVLVGWLRRRRTL
jgi:hypothetical protein